MQSEVLLLLFSCAKGGETCVISDSLCRSLRSTKDAIFLFFAGFLGFEGLRVFGRVWACGFYRLVFFFVLILSLFFSRDVGSEVVLNVNNGCENKNERLPSFGELGSVDQSKTACGLFQIHACCFFLIFLI